jgi:hypothetical protein
MKSGAQSSGSTAQSTLFGRRFGLGSRMIVHTLGLEKNGVLSVSPKMRHRITAMSSTGDDLQSAVASTIRTRFTFCFEKNKKNVHFLKNRGNPF